ncbi:MAG: zinc transporter [Clostridiaceae bacterium]|nr:zinc transporter [Clostridiaceae bacterium]
MTCNRHDHDHEHTHEHSHEHSHDHTHEHSHQHATNKESVANTIEHDEKTLRVLLVHWINHNKSHQENFSEWSKKAVAMEKPDVAKYIEEAVSLMDKANEMLIEAKKHM